MNLKRFILASASRWEIVFVLGTTFAVACIYLLGIPFLELMELKTWDLHFQQRGKIEPSGMIGFVTVDEESVNRDGRWPWPRRQMARLLEAVESYGAKVVGLDMGFFEPDLKLRQQGIVDVLNELRAKGQSEDFSKVLPQLEKIVLKEDDDVILADTIRRFPIPLVLGHFFYFPGSGFLPPAPPDDLLEKAACPIVHVVEEPPDGTLIEGVGLEMNLPVFQQSSRYSGSFNAFADPDGTVRRMPLVIRYRQRIYPSLALQSLAAASPDLPLVVRVDRQGVLDVRLGRISIPTNSRGELLVNFYGPGYTFPHWSASSLLHREAPPGCLQDRLIIIGNTTMGLYDMRTTPFSVVFPGVELHCTVMENIVQQHFFHRPHHSIFYDLTALMGLALIFLLLQFLIRGLPLAGAVALLLGGYILLTHQLFLRPGIWVNHVYPSLNLILAYLGTTLHRYIGEEKEKREIRRTFGLYVHESVVADVLANPDRLRLGGEKKELTVLFSDIRGFTTLSELLPAEELVPQLNEYLTRMSSVIFEHHGTLDKYIGDAIMAIFGAPLPQSDHPYRACATALDMVKTLNALQEEWKQQGRSVLSIGIGINTGMMMVGNMGSEKRFDYTVIGDNVNLASRLEGLTKMYGASIVVSETTWEAVKDRLLGRELDVVRVKGKQHPVSIHEIIGFKEAEADCREPLEAYREALAKYRACAWQEAMELFKNVEQWWPKDPPSVLYQDRCRRLMECPPEDGWTCITVLDHK